MVRFSTNSNLNRLQNRIIKLHILLQVSNIICLTKFCEVFMTLLSPLFYPCRDSVTKKNTWKLVELL